MLLLLLAKETWTILSEEEVCIEHAAKHPAIFAPLGITVPATGLTKEVAQLLLKACQFNADGKIVPSLPEETVKLFRKDPSEENISAAMTFGTKLNEASYDTLLTMLNNPIFTKDADKKKIFDAWLKTFKDRTWGQLTPLLFEDARGLPKYAADNLEKVREEASKQYIAKKVASLSEEDLKKVLMKDIPDDLGIPSYIKNKKLNELRAEALKKFTADTLKNLKTPDDFHALFVDKPELPDDVDKRAFQEAIYDAYKKKIAEYDRETLHTLFTMKDADLPSYISRFQKADFKKVVTDAYLKKLKEESIETLEGYLGDNPEILAGLEEDQKTKFLDAVEKAYTEKVLEEKKDKLDDLAALLKEDAALPHYVMQGDHKKTFLDAALKAYKEQLIKAKSTDALKTWLFNEAEWPDYAKGDQIKATFNYVKKAWLKKLKDNQNFKDLWVLLEDKDVQEKTWDDVYNVLEGKTSAFFETQKADNILNTYLKKETDLNRIPEASRAAFQELSYKVWIEKMYEEGVDKDGKLLDEKWAGKKEQLPDTLQEGFEAEYAKAKRLLGNLSYKGSAEEDRQFILDHVEHFRHREGFERWIKPLLKDEERLKALLTRIKDTLTQMKTAWDEDKGKDLKKYRRILDKAHLDETDRLLLAFYRTPGHSWNLTDFSAKQLTDNGEYFVLNSSGNDMYCFFYSLFFRNPEIGIAFGESADDIMNFIAPNGKIRQESDNGTHDLMKARKQELKKALEQQNLINADMKPRWEEHYDDMMENGDSHAISKYLGVAIIIKSWAKRNDHEIFPESAQHSLFRPSIYDPIIYHSGGHFQKFYPLQTQEAFMGIRSNKLLEIMQHRLVSEIDGLVKASDLQPYLTDVFGKELIKQNIEKINEGSDADILQRLLDEVNKKEAYKDKGITTFKQLKDVATILLEEKNNGITLNHVDLRDKFAAFLEKGADFQKAVGLEAVDAQIQELKAEINTLTELPKSLYESDGSIRKEFELPEVEAGA